MQAHLSPLSVLAAGAVGLLMLESLQPVSSDAPTLRATVETVMTLFALSAAWLARVQFRHSRRLRDLSLVTALVTLGLVRLFTYALPAAIDLRSGSYLATAALFGELLVAVSFAVAAFVPRDKLVIGTAHPEAIGVTLGLAALTVVELGALLLHNHLGGQPNPALGVDGAVRHPLTLAVVLITTGLFGYAAAGFAQDDRKDRRGVASLLAGAAILLAAARFAYLVDAFPPDRFALSDGLQVLGFALILAAGARQELQSRTVVARAAAIAERRRVARDLHDGLAQDLALIAAHGERIAKSMGPEHPVVLAAKHALTISRDVIADLSDPVGATPREALEALAQELRARFGIAIAVDVQLICGLAPDAQEHVSRIAREAIVNAARHGGATVVVVSLTHEDGAVMLRVRDDGRGRRPGRNPAPEGFGLRSMRERAASLGGDLTVQRQGNVGTVLEVVFP